MPATDYNNLIAERRGRAESGIGLSQPRLPRTIRLDLRCFRRELNGRLVRLNITRASGRREYSRGGRDVTATMSQGQATGFHFGGSRNDQ